MEAQKKLVESKYRNQELTLKFEDIFRFLKKSQVGKTNSEFKEAKNKFSFIFENCLSLINKEDDLIFFIEYITGSDFKENYQKNLKLNEIDDYYYCLERLYTHIFKTTIEKYPDLLRFKCLKKLFDVVDIIDFFSNIDNFNLVFNLNYSQIHPDILEIFKDKYPKNVNGLMMDSVESIRKYPKYFQLIVDIYNAYVNNALYDFKDFDDEYHSFLLDSNDHVYYYYERILYISKKLKIEKLYLEEFYDKFDFDKHPFNKYMSYLKKAYNLFNEFDKRQKPNYDVIYSVFDSIEERLDQETLSFSGIKHKLLSIKAESQAESSLDLYIENIISIIDSQFCFNPSKFVDYVNQINSSLRSIPENTQFDQDSYEIYQDFIKDVETITASISTSLLESTSINISFHPEKLLDIKKNIFEFNIKLNQLHIYNKICDDLQKLIDDVKQSNNELLRYIEKYFDKLNRFSIDVLSMRSLKSKILILHNTIKDDRKSDEPVLNDKGFVDLYNQMTNILVIADQKINEELRLENKSLPTAPQFVSQVVYDLNSMRDDFGGLSNCNNIREFLISNKQNYSFIDFYPKAKQDQEINNPIESNNQCLSNSSALVSIVHNAKQKTQEMAGQNNFQIDWSESENEIKKVRLEYVNLKTNLYLCLVISAFFIPFLQKREENIKRQIELVINWLCISTGLSLVTYLGILFYDYNQRNIDKSQQEYIARIDQSFKDKFYVGKWAELKNEPTSGIDIFIDPNERDINYYKSINPSLRPLKTIVLKKDLGDTSQGLFSYTIPSIVEKIWLEENNLNPKYEEKDYYRYMVRNLLILHKIDEKNYTLMLIDRNYNKQIILNIVNDLGFDFQTLFGRIDKIDNGIIRSISNNQIDIPYKTQYAIRIEGRNMTNKNATEIINQIKKQIKHDDLRFSLESFTDYERVDKDNIKMNGDKYVTFQSNRLWVYFTPKLPQINDTSLFRIK